MHGIQTTECQISNAPWKHSGLIVFTLHSPDPNCWQKGHEDWGISKASSVFDAEMSLVVICVYLLLGLWEY